MGDPSADATVPSKPRRRSIFGRLSDWLFSQRHFHLKLLSGTTVGVVVIIFLAGVFLLVTLRNHYQESLRTHTIEVIRLSSLIENDIDGVVGYRRIRLRQRRGEQRHRHRLPSVTPRHHATPDAGGRPHAATHSSIAS